MLWNQSDELTSSRHDFSEIRFPVRLKKLISLVDDSVPGTDISNVRS